MKKSIFFLLPILFCLASCISKSGGTTTYSAFLLPYSPQKVERTVKIKGEEFIYYNVYNDGEGNFVLADESSYIKCEYMSFGVRFQPTACIYDLETETKLEPTSKNYENGDWGYSAFCGFVIRLDTSDSIVRTDVNIGKIGHWC